jgi:hypothetical protein
MLRCQDAVRGFLGRDGCQAPFWAGLRHFSCLIFVAGSLRHYLEDDEDNEIGFRARDCRAIRSVPWEPLGGIGGG